MPIGHFPLVLARKYFPMCTCISISNLHEAGHSATFVLFLMWLHCLHYQENMQQSHSEMKPLVLLV